MVVQTTPWRRAEIHQPMKRLVPAQARGAASLYEWKPIRETRARPRFRGYQPLVPVRRSNDLVMWKRVCSRARIQVDYAADMRL